MHNSSTRGIDYPASTKFYLEEQLFGTCTLVAGNSVRRTSENNARDFWNNYVEDCKYKHGLAQLFNWSSYGKSTLSRDNIKVVEAWSQLDPNSAEWNTGTTDTSTISPKRISPAGVDYTESLGSPMKLELDRITTELMGASYYDDYQHIMWVTPLIASNPNIAYANRYKFTWSRSSVYKTIAHEIGHNLNMGHSNGWTTEYESDAYGNLIPKRDKTYQEYGGHFLSLPRAQSPKLLSSRSH
eukprot:47603-Prymnesium_polylepis.1